MKDLAHPGLPRRSREPAIVPWVHTKGPSVSIEFGDTHGGDMDIRAGIDIEE